jgi:translation elongation factor EF-G
LREAQAYHIRLIEEFAELDEEVMRKYLGEELLLRVLLADAVRRRTISNQIGPVFCGAAFRNKGVQPLLDGSVDYLPSPIDIPAMIVIVAEANKPGSRLASDDERFTAILEAMAFPVPVMAVAIEPENKADADKLSISLHKISQEDPTFRVSIDEETGQTIIARMGELRLEILMDRLAREFQVAADVSRPHVAYKESIRRHGEGEEKFIRQSGGVASTRIRNCTLLHCRAWKVWHLTMQWLGVAYLQSIFQLWKLG